MFRRYRFCLVGLFITILQMQVIVEAVPYDPNDERHRLVTRVRENYSSEIAAHQQLLGTYYHSIALIDLARQRLDAGTFGSSEPDWSLVIRDASLGYGYRDGVVDSTTLTGAAKPKESDYTILRSAYGLSSAFLKAKGNAISIQPNQVYTKEARAAVLVQYVNALNQVSLTVPASIHTKVRERLLLIATVNSLTIGMDDLQRSLVGPAVAAIANHDKHTSAFISACNSLSVGMLGYAKAEVIRAVSVVPRDKYSLFKDTCLNLTAGMNESNKIEVISATATLTHDKLTPAFVTTCKAALTQNGVKIQKIVRAIAAVSADRYVPKFVATLKRLSASPHRLKALLVIEALAIAPLDKYDLLEQAFSSLSSGLDQSCKNQLLQIIASFLAAQDARNFISGCTALSAGKVNMNKLKDIKEYLDR